ncbi:MAG: hypothetical protein R3A12_03060 [Ignavibacteria bacterium]
MAIISSLDLGIIKRNFKYNFAKITFGKHIPFNTDLNILRKDPRGLRSGLSVVAPPFDV